MGLGSETYLWLAPAFFLIALLYASVGHGGASGYLAILSMVAMLPDRMATTALTLNLLVSGTALCSYAAAGYFVWGRTWPFLVASVPAAYAGGKMSVSVTWYALLLAVALCVAAWRLLVTSASERSEPATVAPTVWVALPVGAGIGWASGVVGVGGGIFLSPLLVLCRWANVKQAAATSAAFILANSAAGLLGRVSRGAVEYGTCWPLLVAAWAGGAAGARLGARHVSGVWLKRLLGVVLLVAAVKLFRLACDGGAG